MKKIIAAIVIALSLSACGTLREFNKPEVGADGSREFRATAAIGRCRLEGRQMALLRSAPEVLEHAGEGLVAGDLVDEPVVERDIVDLALGPGRGGRQQVIGGRDLPEVGVGGHLDAHPLQLPHEGRDVPLLGRGDPRIGLHGAVAVEDRGVARVGGILTGRVHEGRPGGLLRGGVDRGRRGRGPGSEGARGL